MRIEPVIVEVLLALIHETKNNRIGITIITAAVNACLKAKGKPGELSADEMRRRLKVLGFDATQRASLEIHVHLSSGANRRAHKLAKIFAVCLSPEQSNSCRNCKSLRKSSEPRGGIKGRIRFEEHLVGTSGVET